MASSRFHPNSCSASAFQSMITLLESQVTTASSAVSTSSRSCSSRTLRSLLVARSSVMSRPARMAPPPARGSIVHSNTRGPIAPSKRPRSPDTPPRAPPRAPGSPINSGRVRPWHSLAERDRPAATPPEGPPTTFPAPSSSRKRSGSRSRRAGPGSVRWDRRARSCRGRPRAQRLPPKRAKTTPRPTPIMTTTANIPTT